MPTTTFEIFKTNITTKQKANQIVKALQKQFVGSKISVDLEDCDRILRIEGDDFRIESIKQNLKYWGFDCEVLD